MAYDAFGNMTQVVHNGTTTPINVDAGSNRLQSVTYDVAGNMVNEGAQWYDYDAFNEMRSEGGPYGGWEANIYTAEDERIGIDQANGTTQRWTIRDFGGNVLTEYEGSFHTGGENFGAFLWIEDWVYAGGKMVTAEREGVEGGVRYFHLDHLGTPRMITNQAKQKLGVHHYSPYGIEQTSMTQEWSQFGYEVEKHIFTGHERDFLGGTTSDNTNYLDYMHARHYNPNMGRFLSVDPILWNLLTEAAEMESIFIRKQQPHG